MDWLFAHHAALDCFNNVVTLNILGKPVIRYQGDHSAVSPCLISALTARKLLAKGCQEILACVGHQDEGSGNKGFFRYFS